MLYTLQGGGLCSTGWAGYTLQGGGGGYIQKGKVVYSAGRGRCILCREEGGVYSVERGGLYSTRRGGRTLQGEGSIICREGGLYSAEKGGGCTMHGVGYTLHEVEYTLHGVGYTLQGVGYTLQGVMYTLQGVRYTLQGGGGRCTMYIYFAVHVLLQLLFIDKISSLRKKK